MRLSTSSNIAEYTLRNMKEFTYTCPESLRMIKNAGFGAADICFCTFCRGVYPMTQPDWQDWVQELKDTAAEIGLPITQSHAHFYDLDRSSNLEWDEELIFRSIRAAGMMNIPWITLHPYSLKDGVSFSRKKSFEVNREMFSRYGELAAKEGVGIAIENMVEHRSGDRRYACGTEELLELVDGMNDSKLFGVCWDTGHAHLSRLNQPEALRQVGKRLKAMHVDDNKGEKDDHVLPYQGTIVWEPIMQALKEIEYEGDFTYEVHEFGNPLPKGLRKQALVYARQTGEYLLSL